MKHFKKIYVLAEEYPEFIYIDNKSYKRFLGSYLPIELYELNSNQLFELNQIRLELGLVDWDYNRYIIQLLFNKATSGKESGKLLDFGIGNGNSKTVLENIKNWQLSGIDISTYQQDNNVMIYDWNSIRDLKLKFDAIISSFVFDFNVDLKDIENLYKCLKTNSRLVFNVYKFWDKGRHFEEILSNLEKVGFEYEIKKIAVPNRFKVKHEFDTIVTCFKAK